MRDYLLFIDTETSGLPVKWDEPYSKPGNWPFTLQISWIVYTKEGREVKTENHFIKENDFEITTSAYKIHGINPEFLLQNGESRKHVMAVLLADLRQYQPLVIGHFMQLDFHMVGTEFYRTGMNNPLLSLPVFCTMLASATYVRNPRAKYLRLGDLYKVLFGKELAQQHNALVDARATADCFFAMVSRGDVNVKNIPPSNLTLTEPNVAGKKRGCSALFLLFFLFSILFFYWL